jgi:hypothetical protein
VGVLVEYLQLWDLLSDVKLQPEIEDKHVFSIASDGNYSAKVAYEGLFMGSIYFSHYSRVWKTWAPPKCRFFSFGSLLITGAGLLIGLLK